MPSRPGEFHPEPLTGRVGDWRAGLGRSLCSPLTRAFVCECHIISTMWRQASFVQDDQPIARRRFAMLHALDLTRSFQAAKTPWQAVSKNDNEAIECAPH